MLLKYRSKMALLTYGSAAFVLILIGYFYGIRCEKSRALKKYSNILQSPQSEQLNQRVTLSPALDHTGVSNRLDTINNVIDTTMRSCLGSFCFDDPVKKGTNDVVRVGLLIPDGIGKEAMLSMLNHVGLHNSDKIEVVFSSNVPPYGYGKNHGWSKIIRMTRSIVPQALQLLINSPNVDAGSIERLVAPQVEVL
jgi:hypothetical protein